MMDNGDRSSRRPALPLSIRACVLPARLILRRYPAAFRKHYAAAALQSAVDFLEGVYRRDGALGVFRRAPRLLWDLWPTRSTGSTPSTAPTSRRSPPAPPGRAGFDGLSLDLRFALRAMARRPASTSLAVLTLALGIGASVAMFSVIDGVLLRPLPYPAAERLTALHLSIPEWRDNPTLGGGWQRNKWEYREFVAWRARQASFERAALVEDVTGTLSGDGVARRVPIGLATLELFEMLGATPEGGRFFVPEDEAGDPVAIVDHGFWQATLGGTDAAIGETITLDGSLYRVVGVLPPGFEVSGFAAEVWLPIFDNRPGGYFPGNTGDMEHVFQALGRLNPDVTVAMATDEATRLLAAIVAAEHFAQHAGNFVPLLADETRAVRSPLTLLMGAVFLLLLVACANVATFLLGQAIERQHEVAVRKAVGAGRGRIVRQLLTESLLLGIVGGAAGLAVAAGGVAAITALAPRYLPRLDAVGLDLRAAGFALAITTGAGLLFGLAPAATLGRQDLTRATRAHTSGTTTRGRLQAALIIAEIAVATVLLVSAGLLTRSFVRLNAVETGFRAADVVMLEQSFDSRSFQNDEGDFQDGLMRARIDEVVAAVEALPGVEAVAIATTAPFSGWSANNSILPEGHQPAEGEFWLGHRRLVSPGYFEVMGMTLIEGRSLEAPDNLPDARSVVVVTDNIARRFWPGESAIGKRFGWWGQESIVVGVVGDIRATSLDRDPEMHFYAAQAPFGQAGGSLMIRTRAGVEGVLEAIRTAAQRVAPDVPISRLAPLEDLIATSLDAVRFRTRLIGVFAVFAAVLSAMGLYGVTSRAVAGRTREMGIRLALGAERRAVIALVLGAGVRLAVVGTVIGIGISLAAARLLAGMLYAVEPHDPATLGAIAALVCGVATAASLVPSLRASRVDAVEALRGG